MRAAMRRPAFVSFAFTRAVAKLFFGGLVAGASFAGVGLRSQSYQTSFSEVKFDRSKGPTTLHGGVEVDAASGAASMNIPLGPGIGERGVKYIPMLRGRVAPQAKVDAFSLDDPRTVQNARGAYGPLLQAATGFNFSPGHLHLVVTTQMSSWREGFCSNFALPDGNTGSVSGSLPSGVNPGALIARFGYGASVTQGSIPYKVGSAKTPFLLAGSTGEVLIGLVDNAAFPEYTITFPYAVNTYNDPNWVVPSKVLLVKGEIAYEYTYFTYASATETSPADHWVPRAGEYLLSSIRNGFGESLAFAYGPNGTDFVATWRPSGGSTAASISVSLAALDTNVAPVRLLRYPGPDQEYSAAQTVNSSGLATVTVAYTGMANAPSYTVNAALDSLETNGTWSWGIQNSGYLTQYFADSTMEYYDYFRRNMQPTRVKVESTGETILFGYGAGPAVSFTYSDCCGTNGTYTYTPTVLSSVSFPGRTIKLDWLPYAYFLNGSNPAQLGYRPPVKVNYRNWWFYGVSAVHDQDTTGGTVLERTTQHQRTLPVPAALYAPGFWSSSTFSDVITAPDGSVRVLKFMEPATSSTPNNWLVGDASDTVSNQIQTLAHLKHMTREERHYESTAKYQGDQPYKVVVQDRWDLRSIVNASGDLTIGAVPYPTRTRTWEPESGRLRIEEQVNWDATQRGWTRSLRYSTIDASPNMSFELLSLAKQGVGPSYSGMQFDRAVTRTLDSDVSRWFWGRVTLEQPLGQPQKAQGFDGATNLPVWTRMGDSAILAIQTDLTYTGALLSSVKLSSVVPSGTSNLALSGQVGADYGYDALGFMNSIQLKGATWNVKQDQDALGRASSQTDANTLSTGFSWDAASRLTAISPPNSEVGTSLQYNDTDYLGVTANKGVQKSEHRFDGFGQLVLTRRWDAANTASHKVFAYDAMGRKTFESIWLAGAGSDTEGRNNGSLSGDRWSFDGQGRNTLHVDANGVTTQLSYSALDRVATLGGGTSSATTTTYRSDALGRLAQVIDAKNQATVYVYDGADRISQVTQYSGPVGTGPTQTRSWFYNNLGWLVQMVQPESGSTYYAAFNVLGKPVKTVYGLPAAWRPASVDREDANATSVNGVKIITSDIDTLGRLKSVASSDGSVNQTFLYEEAGRGYSKARLTTAQDGSVTRTMNYGGLNGRVSGYATSLDGQTFNQSLTYNLDGTLGSRTYPDGKVQVLSYEAAKGAISGVTFNNVTTATLAYDPTHWGLNGITFGNNASSFFGYSTDQTRLASMVHSLPAGIIRSWAYQYDPISRLSTDGEDSYTYDPLGRLWTAVVKDPFVYTGVSDRIQQSFDYDAFGNRTTLNSVRATVGSGGTPPSVIGTSGLAPGDARDLRSYAMNTTEMSALAATNRLASSVGGVSTGAIYDNGLANLGNLTNIYRVPGDSSTQLSLSYDALGRVMSLSDSKRGVAEYYTYDDQGLRTKVEIYQGSVLQKKIYNVYNEARQLVSQYEWVLE